MILAGDIGATKTNLALLEPNPDGAEMVRAATFQNRNYPDIIAAVREFLNGESPPEQACFGAAGPVEQGAVTLTNYPWSFSEKELVGKLGIDRVRLVNDLAALAAAVPGLPESDLETIQAGRSHQSGRSVVLAPGTGLGQAFLIPRSPEGYEILDTEGGQCDFAPVNEVTAELWAYLKKSGERVSVESVLSGPGLVTLYEFYHFRENKVNFGKGGPEISGDNAAEEIAARGLEESEGLFRMVLDQFAGILGTVASNLVLQLLARGGVYLGGGIPPKIIRRLKDGPFLDHFLNKGPFRELLETVPVRVIMNDKAALWGAAALGMDRCRVN